MANVELLNAKRNIYVPTGAVKIASKVDNSVAYQYVNPMGLPSVLAFFGNRAKPFIWFHYSTVEKRNEKITEFFKTVTENQERKTKNRKVAAQPHTLKVDSIVSTSWGYDQTQVEFYQVVELVGKATVVYQELKCHVEEGSETRGDSNRVYAVKGDFLNHGRAIPLRARVNMSGGYPSIKVAYGQNATIWDGKSQHHSWGR